MINEEIEFEKLTVDEESIVRAGEYFSGTSCSEPFPDPGGTCGRPSSACWPPNED